MLLLIYNITLLETAETLLLAISEEERKSAIHPGLKFAYAVVDPGWITAAEYDFHYNGRRFPSDKVFDMSNGWTCWKHV